jgi:hypothetical protein
MPYLRIHKSKKNENFEQFIDSLFSVDPNPKTRESLKPDNWEALIKPTDTPGVSYMKRHELSYLPASSFRTSLVPGETVQTDWSYYYSNPSAAISAIYEYGIALFLLVDSEDAYLRFHKLNTETEQIDTYLVFKNRDVWNEELDAKYNTLRPFLDEITDFVEEDRDMTVQEYNDFVTSIFADIEGMKTSESCKCRLDWIVKENLTDL